MTSLPWKKSLTTLIIMGILLPQFSAFALLGDITNITECALKNRLKQFLKEVIQPLVNFIKDLLRGIVCGIINFVTGSLIKCGVQKVESGELKTLVAKETVEDAIARCIARQALTRMVSGILNIVREKGRDGGPTFVLNWRGFTLQAQYRGENIWRGLLYLGTYGDNNKNIPPLFCKHIRESQVFQSLQPRQAYGLIDSGLKRRVNSLQEYLVVARCDSTVDQNFETFMKDFSRGGGWDTFERLLKPQNNIYGAIGLAFDELEKQRSIEEKADLSEATAGQGFLGKRGENASDSCLSVDISGRCTVYKNIQTPGFVLAESTNATIKVELDWIANVDEINELLTDMFFVMVSRLGNLGGKEPARPPIELNPNLPENLGQINDPEAACANNCIQTYCTPTGSGYDCSNASSQLDACIAACYNTGNGGGGTGVCKDKGGTADYVGSLRSAIDTVITSNPGGIADAPNTTSNSFTFLDYVTAKLQGSGFNATTSVKNGNGNPNNGDLIAVWRSGDSTIERYDAVIAVGAGDRPMRDAATTQFTGDIPLSCVL